MRRVMFEMLLWPITAWKRALTVSLWTDEDDATFAMYTFVHFA